MPAYYLFKSTEVLDKMAMEKMLAEFSTHRYSVAGHCVVEVGEQVGGLAQARRPRKPVCGDSLVAQWCG